MQIRSNDYSFVVNKANQELSRRHFWNYCNYMASDFYLDDRYYLITICNELEKFENDDNQVFIVNAPPRFGKSRTLCLYVEWLLGRNNHYRVMTGSYNETLSTMFSKNVRNVINEINGKYSEIFPNTKIKYGDGAMNLWSLEGNETNNYLATSPSGTATGFGADFIIVDDLIKNAEEANNPRVLEDHWNWFTNTMYSRLEGKRKILIFMTQWSVEDLPHRAKSHFESIGVKVKQLLFSAKNEDGTMLDERILNEEQYENKRNTLSPAIFETNYNNRVIDEVNALYDVTRFKTYQYSELPNELDLKSRVDTADEGEDELVKIVYARIGEYCYLIDFYSSFDKMEITEKECAKMDKVLNVKKITTESNNGGTGFARNVENLTRQLGNTYSTYVWKPTTKNKRTRIITYANNILNMFILPIDWRTRFPRLYQGLRSYLRIGENKHDDIPDCLTACYEDEYVKKASIRF